MANKRHVTLPVELWKCGSEFTTYLNGAVFNLYSEEKDEETGETIEKVYDTYTSGEGENATDGLLFSGELPLGTYILEEVQAPEGYALLGQRIMFVVAENGVTIREPDPHNMVQVENKDGVYQIKVKNNKLYELPSTGGPGTYVFTISGVAMLMTALLLFITNRRKEKGAVEEFNTSMFVKNSMKKEEVFLSKGEQQ